MVNKVIDLNIPTFFAIASFCFLSIGAVGCGPPEQKLSRVQSYGTPVVIAPVQVRELTFSSKKVAILRGDRKINVNFSLPGTIAEFLVKENDLLDEGDPIARLDMLPFKAAYSKARLKLDELKKNKERVERFYKKRLATENEYDQIQAAYNVASKQVEAIKDNLEKVVLRSPCKAIFVDKLAQTGANVYPGMTIGALVAMTPMIAEIEFSDTERNNIPYGSIIDLTMKGIPDKVFKGKVLQKIVSVDPRTQITGVEVSIENPEGELMPGMMAETEIVSEKLNKVVTVPFDSLVYDNLDLCLFVYDPATSEAVRREVKVGRGIDKEIVILDGVKPGEKLIVSGQGFVSDRMTVHVVEK